MILRNGIGEPYPYSRVITVLFMLILPLRVLLKACAQVEFWKCLPAVGPPLPLNFTEHLARPVGSSELYVTSISLRKTRATAGYVAHRRRCVRRLEGPLWLGSFGATHLAKCLVSAHPRHLDVSRRRSAIHLWTPPSRQGKTLGSLRRVVGCCHLSGL